MRNCNIVNDLLPLYVDGLLSQESITFVKEHLSTCKSCLKDYEGMKINVDVVIEDEHEDLKPKRAFAKYLREVKIIVVSLVLFIVSVLLFWVDWFILQYAWSNVYDGVFNTANILLIPLLCLAALFGVTSIVMLVKKNAKSGRNSMSKTLLMIIVLISVLAIQIFSVVELSKTGERVFTVQNIESIESENGEYFLVVEKPKSEGFIKIKCDKNTYYSVIVDKDVLYTFTYRVELFDKNKGILEEQINIDDIVDNRNDPNQS